MRAYLIQQGVVVLPLRPGKNIGFRQIRPGIDPTPCFVSSMPDDYDNAVMIRGVAGAHFGRFQSTGQTMLHPGLKIMVRTLLYEQGWPLAQSIATALDNFTAATIIVDDETHAVQSIYRTSNVIELGEEIGKKRQLFSINARIAMQAAEILG